MRRRAIRRVTFDACRRGTSAVRAARAAVRATRRGRRSARATTLDTAEKTVMFMFTSVPNTVPEPSLGCRISRNHDVLRANTP